MAGIKVVEGDLLLDEVLHNIKDLCVDRRMFLQEESEIPHALQSYNPVFPGIDEKVAATVRWYQLEALAHLLRATYLADIRFSLAERAVIHGFLKEVERVMDRREREMHVSLSLLIKAFEE